MSRVTCPKCGNIDVSWIRDDADCAQYICLECKQGFCYPPKTVFDHITESMETLANSVVMPIIVEYSGDVLWVSPLLQKDASKRAIFLIVKKKPSLQLLKN